MSVLMLYCCTIPTKMAINAAKITDNIADGPAMCRTTCPITTNTVIANVELKATRIKLKAFNLDDFRCSIFDADVIITIGDDTTVSVDPISFI